MLLNVVAPIVLRSPTVWSAVEVNNTSDFAIGLVQSFGFPMVLWQIMIIPSDEYISVSSLFDEDEYSNISTTLPMKIGRAAELAIHAIHVSRYFSVSLITRLIQDKLQSEDISVESVNDTTQTIPLAELLNLVLPPEEEDENIAIAHFLTAASELYKASLGGAVNISRDEATMEFRKTSGTTFTLTRSRLSSLYARISSTEI